MLTNLKLLRREFNISQQKLAEAVGMSQQSINQYENHDTEPDIVTLGKLADFFNTSIDYIVGHTDIRNAVENTTAYHLNDTEADILIKFRALLPNERQCVAHVIDTLLGK